VWLAVPVQGELSSKGQGGGLTILESTDPDVLVVLFLEERSYSLDIVVILDDVFQVLGWNLKW
jgi:hypothetical protein